MENYSLSDLAAVTNEGGFGGNSAWILILLFAMIFNNGMFGNGGGNCATKEDVYNSVQRSTDFAALERQNNEGVAATRQGVYDVTNAVQTNAYNNLSELRDIQSAVSTGFANQQKCCCETLRAIDGVNANLITQSAAIQANSTANTQKILDTMAATKISDLQNEITALKTANAINSATCGVVKYPMASTYNAGYNPFCGCSCNNI